MDFLVLSSSRGTTFQAVLDAIASGSLSAKCLGLLTDRADRECIAKAEAAGVPVWIVDKGKTEEREAYDKRVDETLTEALAGRGRQSVVIAALGWMHILSPWFIRQWKNRVINVHPALLPKYGGTGMFGMRVHEAVIAAKEKESGISIHLMDEGVDTGPILLQKTCPVLEVDSPDALRNRVQALEREWYPKLLEMIRTGEVKLPE